MYILNTYFKYRGCFTRATQRIYSGVYSHQYFVLRAHCPLGKDLPWVSDVPEGKDEKRSENRRGHDTQARQEPLNFTGGPINDDHDRTQVSAFRSYSIAMNLKSHTMSSSYLLMLARILLSRKGMIWGTALSFANLNEHVLRKEIQI